MDRTSRSILLALLVAGSVVVATTSVTDASASADADLGISSVAAAAPAEGGGWWVLERSLQDDGGVLYRYSEDWERTGEVYRIRLSNASDRHRSFSPTDLAPASGGGWWILDDDGRVHRFTADFVHTGASHPLSKPRSEYNATSAYGLVAIPEGGWWLATDRDLWRADEDWRPANDTVVAIYRGGSGYPVAFTYGSDRSLWVLRGYLGASVDRFRLTEGAQIRDVERPQNGFHPLPKLARSHVSYGLDAPDTPVDVTRSGDHWWIVDADGQVHQHDRYWRYTGVTRSVGSGGAVSSYPGHIVSPAVLFVPIILALVLVAPAAVVLVGLAWRRDGADRRLRLAGGAGALLFVYGVVVQPQFLRPIAYATVYLPLVVAGLAIALPAGHLLLARSRGGWYLAKPLVVAYSPVIVSALAMFGPALRPLIAPY